MSESNLNKCAVIKLCIPGNKKPDHPVFQYDLSAAKEVILGRGKDAHIVVDSLQYTMVSRYHAKIKPVLEGSVELWEIEDLNSVNGTFINGVRMAVNHPLQAGDRIKLSEDGPEFVFEYQTKPQPPTSDNSLPPIAEPIIESEPEPIIESEPEPIIESEPEPIIESEPEPI
ncbi:MAG: FHA domain-containing protein, partial [Limnospira maxima]